VIPLTRNLREEVEDAKKKGKVRTLIRLLFHDDVRVRRYAAEALCLLAQEKPKSLGPFVKDLIKALEDPDAEIREAAIEALKSLAWHKPEFVVPYVLDLIELLAGPRNFREKAAKALDYLGIKGPESLALFVDDIVSALNHPNDWVREGVAKLLWYMARRPEWVEPHAESLARALRDPSEVVRKYALRALKKLPKNVFAPALALLAAYATGRDVELEILRKMGYRTSYRSLGRICEERAEELLRAGRLSEARRYLEAAREHYKLSRDYKAVKRVSSLLSELLE